jgi:Mycoplasma protein of unknown function, DUF285
MSSSRADVDGATNSANGRIANSAPPFGPTPTATAVPLSIEFRESNHSDSEGDVPIVIAASNSNERKEAGSSQRRREQEFGGSGILGGGGGGALGGPGPGSAHGAALKPSTVAAGRFGGFGGGDDTESTARTSLDPDGDNQYIIVEAVEVRAAPSSKKKKKRSKKEKKRRKEKKKRKEKKRETLGLEAGEVGDNNAENAAIGNDDGVNETGSSKKKKRKSKKKKRRKNDGDGEGEAELYDADGVVRSKSSKSDKKKEERRRRRKEERRRGRAEGGAAADGGAHGDISDAEESSRYSESTATTNTRSKRDPDADHASVASSSMTSAASSSYAVDPNNTSLSRSALGTDNEEEDETDEYSDGDWDDDDDETDDGSLSLFLSPSNECDTSATSDDCFEPSPEWLESVRAQHARYSAMLATPRGKGSAVFPTHENDSSIDSPDPKLPETAAVAMTPEERLSARNLHYEFLIGQQPAQQQQQVCEISTRPSFQSPISDLSPNSASPHREGVELVDAEARKSSSARFDPTALPVIAIPRGADDEPPAADGNRRSGARFGHGQDAHLQKSLTDKQKRERRKRWIVAGFVALNVLLAIGVALPFLIPWIQSQMNGGSVVAPAPESPQQVKCFETSQELEEAVDQYLELPQPVEGNATVVLKYGYIRDWCVDSVTSMDALFSSKRNPRATSFNEPITPWNVGSVTSMRSMFESAASFDQDLSSWDVRLVQDLSGMFLNAVRYRQNLCDWLSLLPTGANLTDTFTNTSCDSGAATSDVGSDDGSAPSNGTSVFLCLECFTSY